MKAVRFHAVIEKDEQAIRPPEGLHLESGRVEVIVLQPGVDIDANGNGAADDASALIDRLSRVAEEQGISGLPSDLAENHDHYAHGLTS